MVLRSTAAEPRPTEPLRFTSAEVWARTPLISTSVWSGPWPRRVAGRTESVPSVLEGRGKSIDGTVAASAAASSVVPCFCNDLAVTTSTGASDSRRERGSARLPVTTSSWTSTGAAALVWATTPVANRLAAEAAAKSTIRDFMNIPWNGLRPWGVRRPTTLIAGKLRCAGAKRDDNCATADMQKARNRGPAPSLSQSLVRRQASP